MTTLEFQCRPASDAERHLTVEGLKNHTQAATGHAVSHEPFGLVGYDGGTLASSIVGKVFFNWLHLDLVWVHESYRGNNIGRHSMDLAAQQAQAMGLAGIEVWTQSWQAPEFYRKIGYEEFAVLADFLPGCKRYAFRRYLSGDKHP